MKLPKVLLNSIVIGMTAGAVLACSKEEVISPRADSQCGVSCSVFHGEDCPANKPDPCPACGLG